MEGGGELLLNAKEIIEQGPKLGVENRLLVADNRVGKTVVLYYHIDNYLCKAQNIDSNFN